jgi:hypothetical protein
MNPRKRFYDNVAFITSIDDIYDNPISIVKRFSAGSNYVTFCIEFGNRIADAQFARSTLLYLKDREMQIKASCRQRLISHNVAKPVACMISDYITPPTLPILTLCGGARRGYVCDDRRCMTCIRFRFRDMLMFALHGEERPVECPAQKTRVIKRVRAQILSEWVNDRMNESESDESDESGFFSDDDTVM